MTVSVVIGVYVLTKYLSKGESTGKNPEIESLRKEVSDLRNIAIHTPDFDEITELTEKLEAIYAANGQPTADQRNKLIKEFMDKARSQIGEDFIRDIKDKLSSSIPDANNKKEISEHILETTNRLRKELFSLSKRGNLNLSIGIVITMVGLLLLGTFVFQSPIPQNASAEYFIINFIPRISLVILIEIFAYFFLSLYKTSLSEIKYFQNEITTIESKYLALKVALHSGKEESLAGIIGQLSATERNFILNKDQSTVDLERAKLDQKTTADIIGSMASLLNRKS